MQDAENRLAPRSWGELAAAEPFSHEFGIDRGTPIDRIFIEAFLDSHADLVRGHVLEIADDTYARRYGNGKTTVIDVLDVDSDNSAASIVGDLNRSGSLPRDTFDCAIVTQTLQYVEDLEAAVANLHGCLVPGGTLLVTVPGITRIDPGVGRVADRWRFTPHGLSDLLARRFQPDAITSTGYGDLHAATAFLYGLAAEEIQLPPGDKRTSDFPVVVCASAARR